MAKIINIDSIIYDLDTVATIAYFANKSMQQELEELGTPNLNEVLPAHASHLLKALQEIYEVELVEKIK